jgi:ABC-type branched-subunit amino acid transport system substrate-binding protein
MNRIPLTKLLAVGTALVVPVALAACGSDSKKDDDGSAGLKGAPIKIMTIYPSGGVVSFPDLPDGAKAAVKSINESGGVKGRPLKLLTCSDGNNANASADCGRKAIKEGVVALVGSTSTFSTTYLPILTAKQIPSIGNGAASAADFVGSMAFPIGGGPSGVFGGLPRFLADEGAKRIVMVRPDLAPAANAVKSANEALKPLGQQIVGQVPVPISAPDMTSYVAQVASQKADGVVVILPGAQSISFVEGLRESTPNVKIALASTEPALHKALGDQIDGIITSSDVLPMPGTTTPAALEYEKQMKSEGFKVDNNGVNAWLSVRILADLAKDMPEITGPALVKKLNKTVNLKTGFTPPLQWVRGNVGGTPRSFTACSLAIRFDADGKQKLVTGKFFDAYQNRPCRTP